MFEKARTFYNATENGSSGVLHLQHNTDGLLNVSKYQYSTPCIAVECSDACGCGDDCPNRRIQQGNTPSWDLNSSRWSRFSKGEDARDIDEGRRRKQTYDATFRVMDTQIIICAQYHGGNESKMSLWQEKMQRMDWLDVIDEEDEGIPRIGLKQTESEAVDKKTVLGSKLMRDCRYILDKILANVLEAEETNAEASITDNEGAKQI